MPGAEARALIESNIYKIFLSALQSTRSKIAKAKGDNPSLKRVRMSKNKIHELCMLGMV